MSYGGGNMNYSRWRDVEKERDLGEEVAGFIGIGLYCIFWLGVILLPIAAVVALVALAFK